MWNKNFSWPDLLMKHKQYKFLIVYAEQYGKFVFGRIEYIERENF
jgi:hypothetical protein